MPFIKSLEISGLRGFRKAQTVKLAIPNGQIGSGMTYLTGPNNAGKSTIVEAIQGSASHGQPPSFNVGMRNPATDAVALKYVYSDGSDGEVASVKAGSSETKRRLNGEVSPYIVPSRRYFSPYFGRTSVQSRGEYSRHSGSHRAFREQILSSFEGRLFKLEGDNDRFNNLIQKLIPTLESWSIDQSEQGAYFIKIKTAGKLHGLTGVGDGVVSLFVIAAALFDSEPGDIIAIDEPELSLHPSFQRRLSKIITEYSSERQIILATHSPYFVDVNALLNGAILTRTWERDLGIRVYQIASDGGAPFEALTRLAATNLNNPHVFGLDAKEMFFLGDGVIVLEGQEDVVLWPRVIAGHGEFENVSLFGWGAGGAGNIGNVCSVLRALGFEKVSGVLDGNMARDLEGLRKRFPMYLFEAIPADDVRTKPAVAARNEVVGLLDDQLTVRPEYGEPLTEVLKRVTTYFS